MGSSVGIQNIIASSDPFASRLQRFGGIFFRDDADCRDFVEFVKDGEWQDYFIDSNNGNDLVDEVVKANPWKRYGYKANCELDPKISFRRSASSKSLADTEVSSMHISEVVHNDYSTDDMAEMFMELLDLKALIVMVLYPLYAQQLLNYEDKSVIPLNGLDSCLSDTIASKLECVRGGERVLAILLRASAAVDSDELIEYLAQPESGIVEDLKDAFSRLSVRVMIGRIDIEKKESTIIYTNERNLPSASDSVVGHDLHIVCGNTCSPGTAMQLHRAVFTGKTMKKSYAFSPSQNKLLAVLPIRNHKKELTYSVSIESDVFNPTYTSSLDSHFQQIEDLLVLLPFILSP